MTEFEERARATNSPAELADAFSVLLKLDSPPKAIATRSGDVTTTGETIAIVIGFIRAIISGITLLILLC